MSTSLDFETQLHTIPVRNEKLVVAESDGPSGALIVEVQLRYRGPLGGIANFVKARRRKRYELAGLSRELFEKLDGERTVENLVDWLCEQDRLTFLESRALVLHYLRDLMRRGLIVAAVQGGRDR
jgi:hypothetical protein